MRPNGMENRCATIEHKMRNNHLRLISANLKHSPIHRMRQKDKNAVGKSTDPRGAVTCCE